jgi:hypothetical protein
MSANVYPCLNRPSAVHCKRPMLDGIAWQPMTRCLRASNPEAFGAKALTASVASTVPALRTRRRRSPARTHSLKSP